MQVTNYLNIIEWEVKEHIKSWYWHFPICIPVTCLFAAIQSTFQLLGHLTRLYAILILFTKGTYYFGLRSGNLIAHQATWMEGRCTRLPSSTAFWVFSLTLCCSATCSSSLNSRGLWNKWGAWEIDLPWNRLSMPRISILQPCWKGKTDLSEV